MSYPIRLALAAVAAVASVAGGTSAGARPISTDAQVVTAAIAHTDIDEQSVDRVDVDAKAGARSAQLSVQADLISQAASELKAQEQRKSQGYDPTTTDPREIARQLMANTYGWGDAQFQCFDNIIMHESKWSITATNPTSGAYGIPQALPGSKMATAGADWKTNPATQITWALGYVKARYSTPCGAWSFKSAHGWY
jgi:hypothetical protein